MYVDYNEAYRKYVSRYRHAERQTYGGDTVLYYAVARRVARSLPAPMDTSEFAGFMVGTLSNVVRCTYYTCPELLTYQEFCKIYLDEIFISKREAKIFAKILDT